MGSIFWLNNIDKTRKAAERQAAELAKQTAIQQQEVPAAYQRGWQEGWAAGWRKAQEDMAKAA